MNNKDTGRREISRIKVKFSPITCHEGTKGEKYSSTLSLNSALDGMRGWRNAPAALPPRMTRYPEYRKLGGTQGQSGRVRKISHPPGFYPRTVQPVASHYIDYAIIPEFINAFDWNYQFYLKCRVASDMHLANWGNAPKPLWYAYIS
jgi:hypothetical protein